MKLFVLVFYMVCIFLSFDVFGASDDSPLMQLRYKAVEISEMGADALVQELSLKAFPDLANIQLDVYVFPVGCNAALELMWGLAGVVSEVKNAELVYKFSTKISKELAAQCLLASHAYNILLEKSPKQALIWMESRASSPATLLDILVAGRILWGDSFAPIPKGTPTPIPFESSPISPPKWGLPFAPAASWRALYKGQNAVYKMIAVHAIDSWGNERDKNDFINRGALDSNYEIQRMWLLRITRLPAEKQTEILEQVLAKRKSSVFADKYKEEGEIYFYNELNRHLRKVKQASKQSKLSAGAQSLQPEDCVISTNSTPRENGK